MIDCQTGIVLHKYKAPGEVSARPCPCRLLTPGTGALRLDVQSQQLMPHDHFLCTGVDPSALRMPGSTHRATPASLL